MKKVIKCTLNSADSCADDELYFEQTLFWSKKDRLSATAQLFLDFYLAAAKTDRH